MKFLFALITLLILPIFFLSFLESRPIRDVEPDSFMSLDDFVGSMSSFEDVDEYRLTVDGHPKYPKHPKHPPHFPHRRPKRAYVHFPSPPNIAAGVVIFWESKNLTLISGQFTKGFVEGDEKDYSFKVYKGDKEVLDLKPEDGSLDKIFKIRSNGSTDIFLFVVNDTLVSSRDLIGGELVISKPDALIGKDRINYLSCR